MKSPYSTAYAEARAQFIEATRATNATVESHELSSTYRRKGSMSILRVFFTVVAHLVGPGSP
jgi:hypothetical protein